ncbi:MAG TPA: hypothetical protein VNT81_07910 [Vicinamibacterales bacterium]|nr:hypothetical protein [Vicinamibacterales bacterium]
MRRPFSLSPAIAVALAIWLVAIGVGFAQLWRHAYTPGPPAEGAPAWPADLPRDASRPTLVMVVHPECGCSEASISELARLMARARMPFNTVILFQAIGGSDATAGRLWSSASALPGVTAIVDHDGSRSRAFGARVSGQAFLFDRGGALLFSGGLTAARAHAGDNDGVTAVLAALHTGSAPLATTPVFGCLLNDRSAS